MVIIFTPAQGETVAVCVPPYSSTIDVHFSAVFASQEDYNQARWDGVGVELWSNIPVGKDDRWEAIRFQWAPDHRHNLGACSPIICGMSNTKVLHLKVAIPISGRNQIEYTYRLVYPSGEIKWLGDYERNGILVFKCRDPRFVHGNFFGSHIREGTFSFGPDKYDNKEVARLSQDVGWSIFAIREDGLVCTCPFAR
jgi:hypothetical protein